MICSRCGLNNADDYIFCTDCGTTLSQHKLSDPENVTWTFTPKARAEKLLGRIIENKYKLDAILGIGGMGTVFRSTRLNLGDQVAVKILHPELMQDREAAERFNREAQMAARVKHPNAINIFDVGVTPDGLEFIVMEFFDGQSLREIIKRQKNLELKFITTVITQVCSALDEAHRQGITHRDIKPDNILISQISNKIHVKVLDFGIAKLLDKSAVNLTQTGSVMGTPQYMSPEQCMGEELDCRADIYSVGVMLYEMLCGKVPFNAPNPNAIAIQHVQKTPPSLQQNCGVTPEIEQAVLRSLAKNPSERQQSAGKLAYDLDLAVSESLGISTPITLDSVSLKREDFSRHQFQENAARRLTPPASGAVETNANQPTRVNQIDIQSGRQTPFSGSPSGGIRQAEVKNTLSSGKIAVVASAVLILTVAAGSFMFFNGAENGGEGREGAKESKKETTKSENSKSESPQPPAGMVRVPGGSFMMGGNEYLYDGKNVFRSPPHQVSVKPFFMDVHEVTCEEYKKFVDATNYPPPPGWSGGNYPAGKGKFPVTDVNWDAANAYAKWSGKRLPTEAEWEFAARGTDGRLYSWGNEWQDGMANANEVNKGMVAVGSYKGASPFGIYDMIGNAWEWTATTLEPYPNGTVPKLNRNDIERKIIRGGSWESPASSATTTYRGFYGVREESEGYKNTSFRCVKDIPEQ